MANNIAYLSLGTNIGNLKENLETAMQEISKIGKIIKKSSFYKTEPVDFKNQNDFLNNMIAIETDLSALELIIKLQEIEHCMGRVKEVENGPRIIDIDIIFYNYEIINFKNLQIPHPRFRKRNFVLTPLKEIASHFIDPQSQKTINLLHQQLKNPEKVALWT